MMKSKILYIIIIAFIGFNFISCEKDITTEDTSRITNFVQIDLKGSSTEAVEVGNDYIEPGFTATEGEDDVASKVIIDGSVDGATVGIYSLSYSAENVDGFSAAINRTVAVYDPTITPTNVAGNIQDVGRNERKGVISLVPGTTNIFYCTDMAFGGVFPLYFQMDGDEMTVIPQPFNFGVTEVEASYDPVNKTFSVLIVDYGYDYNFEYE